MSGLFLDTTIVVEVAAKDNLGVRKKLDQSSSAAVPIYALRELLAGYLSILCDLHNRIAGSSDIGEALVSISRIPSVAGRRKDTAISEFAQRFRRCLQISGATFDSVREEMLGDLALSVTRVWMDARGVAKNVQPLGCFSLADLKYGDSGEVRGPNGRFSCDPKAKCGAATYVYEKDVALSSMIDSLHPDRLEEPAASKNENRRRRKVLKDLKEVGPSSFNKRGCRAIGDAYFVALCPPGFSIFTSNKSDFEPICAALQIKLVVP